MKKTVLAIVIAAVLVIAAGCVNYDFEQTGQYIVTAKTALDMAKEGVIIVDAQSAEDYAAQHVERAVSIPMSALIINEPYDNMLPEAAQVEEVMGGAGITENDTILVYDNSANMQAARIQWTLNIYGNFNVRVVSGGLEALKKAGAAVSTEAAVLPEAEYKTGDRQKTLIVSLDYIKAKLNNPEEGLVIIDTRTDEEFAEGTIPGSQHINYIWNNYPSGEYKSPMDIQSTYLGKAVYPDMKLIIFCKTSVRAAQTYTALKDAGYKDVRIYDGAWLEYSDKEKPQAPSASIAPSKQDAS